MFLENSDMSEKIKLLDEKMEVFKHLEETAIKYNGWQEELRTDLTNFENIEELRECLTNRHLMWHSLDEWKILKESYEKMLFAEINAEEISKKADHYQKIANRIIKILPPNPIQDQPRQWSAGQEYISRSYIFFSTSLRRPPMWSRRTVGSWLGPGPGE